jgi:hypothetical protein
VRLLLLEARDEHAAHGTQALPVIVVATPAEAEQPLD